jgi:large-conductance mechanosensitive channel
VDLFVQEITALAALLSVAAFYLSFIVYKRYQSTSIGWGLLSLAVGVMALQRIGAAAWAYGALAMTIEQFLQLSSIMYVVISTIVFIAAWEVNKVTKRYKLVEIKELRAFTRELRKRKK